MFAVPLKSLKRWIKVGPERKRWIKVGPERKKGK